MCSAIERTQNIIQIYNKEKKILLKKIFLFFNTCVGVGRDRTGIRVGGTVAVGGGATREEAEERAEADICPPRLCKAGLS